MCKFKELDQLGFEPDKQDIEPDKHEKARFSGKKSGFC